MHWRIETRYTCADAPWTLVEAHGSLQFCAGYVIGAQIGVYSGDNTAVRIVGPDDTRVFQLADIDAIHDLTDAADRTYNISTVSGETWLTDRCLDWCVGWVRGYDDPECVVTSSTTGAVVFHLPR